jgi:hypothetical protein
MGAVRHSRAASRAATKQLTAEHTELAEMNQ